MERAHDANKTVSKTKATSFLIGSSLDFKESLLFPYFHCFGCGFLLDRLRTRPVPNIGKIRPISERTALGAHLSEKKKSIPKNRDGFLGLDSLTVRKKLFFLRHESRYRTHNVNP